MPTPEQIKSFSSVPKYHGGPKVRALELMLLDRAVSGSTEVATKERILDEERTWVAELLAQQTGEAVIPRHYQRFENDIVDQHGVSLVSVLDGGIYAIEQSKTPQKVGANKELVRRKAERANLSTQITMPKNTYMVECSMTDHNWSSEEQKAWGYSGDMLVRVTYVDTYGDVKQATICVQEFGGEKALRATAAVFANKRANTALELLANPKTSGYTGSFESLIAKIQLDIDRARHKAHPVLSLLKVIKRVKSRKKEAWGIVSANKDLDEQLWQEMQRIALLPVSVWEEKIDEARRGFWKLTLEREAGKISNDTIGGAAARSRRDGDVFTACGDTSETTAEAAGSYSYASRLCIVATLGSAKGRGRCGGCKTETTLYGCGDKGTFCRTCNDTWCQEFLASGKMLEADEIREARYRWRYRWI